MNKDILLVADAVSHEKGVDKAIIFQAIEEALAIATQKRYDENADIRVVIDPQTGDYETFRQWLVVSDDELAELGTQFTTEEAAEVDGNLAVGDTYQIKVENIDFGRIAAQTAKQVIVQKVREAERSLVVEHYRDRVGNLVNGSVKKVTRDNIIVDLGNNAEGLLPKKHIMPREIYRVGDRVRAILEGINEENRGPQLLLSRTCDAMLIELLHIEVPEVSEQVIEICGAARDPGSRAKVAVKTNDGRIDPVGACVGMRGARVQAISSELHGERVDIILWDDDPIQLVIHAMSPSDIESIVVDEELNTMDVLVAEEDLAQAIGRLGQNVRLASKLTGWRINVMNHDDWDAKQEHEAQSTITTFVENLEVDTDLAETLVAEGFMSLEDVAYTPLGEIADIEGFDDDIAQELSNRAKDALLTQAMAKQSHVSPAQDLLSMEGMDNELASQLGTLGISTMEDLAEQSIDDLIDIEGMTKERASALILTARAPWFED